MTLYRQRRSRHRRRGAGRTADDMQMRQSCTPQARVSDDAVTDLVAAVSNVSTPALRATRLSKDRRAMLLRAAALAD